MLTHTLTDHTEQPQMRPLGWDRALRLDTAIKAATGAVALVALVIAAVILWWCPSTFLPSYFAHGIRYWVLLIPFAGLLGTLVEAVSDRLEAEQFAAMGPERHLQPSEEGGIGGRCVLLAILTTSPVWPQLAHLWTSNTLHGGGTVAASLVLHLAPSLVLAVVTALAVVAVGEYRAYLETTQWAIDCAEINAHAEHRTRQGIRTPMAVEVTDLFGRPRDHK